jgi:DNA-binding FadR family transcriptional regulator
MGGREAYLKLLQGEHRAIVEAIQEHDPKAARDALRRHLTRSVERYRKLAAEQKAAA